MVRLKSRSSSSLLHHTLAQHEGVVAQRLNLQEIVPGGDALELRKVLALHHRLKQLSRLAGRADNESLPVLVDEALGHDGVALEVVQVRGRDELVEIAQAQLVLGQHDEVLGLAAWPCPRSAQPGHGRIDACWRVCTPLSRSISKKGTSI